MKRSLARSSAAALAAPISLTFALVFASIGGLCVAACADSDLAPPSPSQAPVDAGDAGSPPSIPEDAGPAPEASIDAGPRTCSYHGFCPTSLPAAQTIVGVWSDGAGAAWAVTTEGNVLRWDGATWTIHASGLGPLTAVWGSGPTDVWIGGDSGVQHGQGPSSAALTFTPSALPDESTHIASIWGASGSDLWAVGTGSDPDTGMLVGNAFHFSGESWALEPVTWGAAAYTHVWGTAGSGVWIAGRRPMVDMPWLMEVVVSRRRGVGKFTEIALPEDPHLSAPLGTATALVGATAATDTSIWLHGSSVASWPITWRGTSSDGGETFTFTAERDGSPNAPQIHAVFGTAADDVWTAGDYGQVRHWDGTRWTGTAVTTTNLPVTDPFYAVWARGSSEVWLAGKDIALRYDPAQDKDGGAR